MKKTLFTFLIALFFQSSAFAGESGDENTAKVLEKSGNGNSTQSIEKSVSTEPKIVKDEKKEIVEIDVDKITDALKEKLGPSEEPKQSLVEKIDPFSKDLNTTREERKNLDKDSLYPVASFKLVATILSGDLNNMALIQLPGLNKDQVIVSEGQKIGRDQGIVKEISETTMLVEENRKILKLTIEN